MTPLTSTILRDFRTGSTQIKIVGCLTAATEPELSALLLHGSLDAPLILMIDLDGMAAADATPIASFLERWEASRSLGPPLVLLVNPFTPTGRLLRAMLGSRATICDSVIEGLRVARRLPAAHERSHARLPADRHSPSAARQLIGSACRAWHLDDLADNAMVVASELVSNAVEHARTELDLAVIAGPGSLKISVRDRVVGIPHPAPVPAPADLPGLPERGRGLPIIEALALDWGHLTFGDGKTVWATIGKQQSTVRSR